MDRRRVLGMVGAMALATVMGVGADAAEKTKAATAACAYCGDACACPACTCGATAKAGAAKTGMGCDCGGGAAGCSSSAGKTAQPKVAVARSIFGRAGPRRHQGPAPVRTGRSDTRERAASGSPPHVYCTACGSPRGSRHHRVPSI